MSNELEAAQRALAEFDRVERAAFEQFQQDGNLRNRMASIIRAVGERRARLTEGWDDCIENCILAYDHAAQIAFQQWLIDRNDSAYHAAILAAANQRTLCIQECLHQ